MPLEEVAVFSDVGWGEVLVILVAAVIIFGPDKLPKLAADLAKGLRLVRNWAQRARSELDEELPPEFKNLDLGTLHPKTFVRKALLEDDPLGLDDNDRPRTNGHARTSSSTPARLEPGQPAPYDADAT